MTEKITTSSTVDGLTPAPRALGDEAPLDRGLQRSPGVAGGDQVQAAVDAANAQGYYGTSPDPTPREHYTVAGVIAGKPTPETDLEAAAAVATVSRSGDAAPPDLLKQEAAQDKAGAAAVKAAQAQNAAAPTGPKSA